jgi:hypothetical protein
MDKLRSFMERDARSYSAAHNFCRLIYDMVMAGLRSWVAEFVQLAMIINEALGESKVKKMVLCPYEMIDLEGLAPRATWDMQVKASKNYCSDNIEKGQALAQTLKDAGYVPPSEEESGGRDLRVAIWMWDAATRGPTVELAWRTLMQLQQTKGLECFLYCRKKPGKNGFDKDHPPVRDLITAFDRAGRLKMFEQKADDKAILQGMLLHKPDVVLHINGFAFGHICPVLAAIKILCPFVMILEWLQYCCLMYGIVDFVITSRLLLTNGEILSLKAQREPGREASVFTKCPYPSQRVLFAPSATTSRGWPLPQVRFLVFPGTLDRGANDPTFEAWFRIVHGVDEKILLLVRPQPATQYQWMLRLYENFRRRNHIEPDDFRLMPHPFLDKWEYSQLLSQAAFAVLSLGPKPPHTGAGDVLDVTNVMLCHRGAGARWPALVPATMLSSVGLECLVATSADEFVDKGVHLLLNPQVVQSMRTHLRGLQDQSVAFYNQSTMAQVLAQAIPQIVAQGKKTRSGQQERLEDIDSTVTETPVASFSVAWFSVPSPAAPLGRTPEDEFRAVASQLRQRGLLQHPVQEDLLRDVIQQLTECGIRGFSFHFNGSSVICLVGVFHGPERDGLKHGQRLAIKMTNCKRNLRSVDRLVHDPVHRALVWQIKLKARAGRRSWYKGSVPAVYSLFPRGGCLGVAVRRTTPQDAAVSSRLGFAVPRSKAAICFSVHQFIDHDMHRDPKIRSVIEDFTRHGMLSESRRLILQAIFEGLRRLQSVGAHVLDISAANVAISSRETRSGGSAERYSLCVLDMGNGVVLDEKLPTPLVRLTTQAAGIQQSGLPVSKARELKCGVSFLNPADILNRANACDSQECTQGFRGMGTPTFQELALVDMFRDPKETPLVRSLGSRFDGYGCASLAAQTFHPVRDVDEWCQRMEAARQSREAMHQFVLDGISGGKPPQQPEAVKAYAYLLFGLLDPDLRQRTTMTDALVSRVISLPTLTPAQSEALSGDGIPFPGGNTVLPEESPWRRDGLLLPAVSIVQEPLGEESGAGVRADQDIAAGTVVAMYAGTEVGTAMGTTLDDFPPNRYVARLTGELYVMTDQSLEWLQAKNVAGPLMNGVISSALANVELSRVSPDDRWRDNATGILYVLMRARRDIKKGEFLRWEYDHEAGGGGCNSYHFP